MRAVDERGAANVGLAGAGLTPTSRSKGHQTAASKALASPWFALTVAVVALALPYINSQAYTLRIATDALIFIMLAVGLNIVVGYCGLLDLGYAAFFAIGACIGWLPRHGQEHAHVGDDPLRHPGGRRGRHHHRWPHAAAAQ